MRTTNFVCGILACIAATSMVDAVAIDQVQQIPIGLAQAQLSLGEHKCKKRIKKSMDSARKVSDLLMDVPNLSKKEEPLKYK